MFPTWGSRAHPVAAAPLGPLTRIQTTHHEPQSGSPNGDLQASGIWIWLCIDCVSKRLSPGSASCTWVATEVVSCGVVSYEAWLLGGDISPRRQLQRQKPSMQSSGRLTYPPSPSRASPIFLTGWLLRIRHVGLPWVLPSKDPSRTYMDRNQFDVDIITPSIRDP